MNSKNYKFVIVYWRDAWSDSSWLTLEEAKKRIGTGEQCKTCGWLFHEDDQRIGLVQSLGIENSDGSSDLGNIWIIPTGMVEEIIEIDEPKKGIL